LSKEEEEEEEEKEEEDSKRKEEEEKEEEEEEKKKKKKNFGKYFNGLCCIASETPISYNKKDGLCGMGHSSDSKRSQKSASDSDSEDEVCDELSSLCKENEELVDLLDNRDHMLRESKKLRKKLRA
jgi:hypothetical protein